MKSIIFCSFFILCAHLATGQESKMFGAYQMKEFMFKERPAKIVFPTVKNNQGLWIWRARFWGHEPQTDLALLEKGFHVVYIDVAGLYGNTTAVELWNAFYHHLIDTYNLNKKVVLEGFSRGGLIVYNWASKNTDKVACIYADAPVCDIKSWPGGLYAGEGSAADWALCLKAYNLDEKNVLKYQKIPLNTSIEVAKEKIPVLHVYGDADNIVPPKENTELLARKFKKAGGKIVLIKKPGIGHHPHSLKDPQPIVNFILKHTADL